MCGIHIWIFLSQKLIIVENYSEHTAHGMQSHDTEKIPKKQHNYIQNTHNHYQWEIFMTVIQIIGKYGQGLSE